MKSSNPQQIRQQFLRTVQYNENNSTKEPLPRGMVYRELYLRLKGQINVGANAYTANNAAPGVEFAVIKSIRILVNGNIIRNLSGEALDRLNIFQYGINRKASPGFAAAVAANGTIDFDSTMILPFWTPGIIKPITTALDSSKLSSFEIEIQWGNAGDIFVPGTGPVNSATFSVKPTVDVYGLQSFGYSGPFNTTRLTTLVNKSVDVQQQFERAIPIGNMYKSFLINTKSGSVYDSDDSLNSLSLVSGATQFAKYDAKLLNSVSLQRRGIDGNHNFFPNQYDTLDTEAMAKIGAWYQLDLVTDGYLSEAIDTLGWSELNLVFDVAKQCDIYIYPFEIIPIRTPQNANGG